MYMRTGVCKIFPDPHGHQQQDTFNTTEKSSELLNTIEEKKIRYLNHIMRSSKYEIQKIIIEGKIVGRRSTGRR